MAAAQKSLKDKPSEKDLNNKIAMKAGGNWRALLTNLGLDAATIEQFRQSNSGDTAEVCFRGLTNWLGGNADKPVTWEKLLEALRDSSMVGIADDLEKELESSPKERQIGGPSHSNPSSNSKSSQSPICKRPSDAEVLKDFFKSFKDNFLAKGIILAKDIRVRLFDAGIIPQPIKEKIGKTHDDYNAVSLLYNHMEAQGDKMSTEKLLKIMIETKGYPQMNSLGERMHAEFKTLDLH